MKTRNIKFASAFVLFIGLIFGTGATGIAQNQQRDTEDDTYEKEAVIEEATDFLGGSAQAIASVVEKVFKDQGKPIGYIKGSEAGGGFIVGLRYGNGQLHHKIEGVRRVHWTGPSIGFDVGGNASKSFTLVYNLHDTEELYSRFPAVEGSFYYIGGVGVNYQRKGKIVLAPIRVGAGLRVQASLGYIKYSKKRKWSPF